MEWTGTGSDTRVDIDLYYCGSYCTEVGICKMDLSEIQVSISYVLLLKRSMCEKDIPYSGSVDRIAFHLFFGSQILW